MSSVHACVVFRTRGIGSGDIIYILVFFHCFSHQDIHCLDSVTFTFGSGKVEIPSFPVDGVLENQRLARMCSLEPLNERKEPFLDFINCRIGERVKDECVNVGSLGQCVCEVWLHFAVSGTAKA